MIILYFDVVEIVVLHASKKKTIGKLQAEISHGLDTDMFFDS